MVKNFLKICTTVTFLFINIAIATSELFNSGNFDDDILEFSDYNVTDWQEFDDNVKPVKYYGAQVWRLLIENNLDEKLLRIITEKFDTSIWGETDENIDLLIKNDSINELKQLMAAANISYTISIEDLQELIDEGNLPEEETRTKRSPIYNFSWKNYYGLPSIYNYFAHLEKNFPKLCKVITIGRTVNNVKIQMLRIGDHLESNRSIVVESGIHAREWITVTSVIYILSDFLANWRSKPIHIQDAIWYFIPILNPEGYNYSRKVDRLWRKNRRRINKNCVGVDLNRNFGYQWGVVGSSANPCDLTYRGPRQFSEHETQSVRNLLEEFNQMPTAYIAFHSYSQRIILPYVYNGITADSSNKLRNVAIKAAQDMKLINGHVYKVGDYPKRLSGVSIDWVKHDIKSEIAYIVELPDKGRYNFLLPPKFIIPVGKEALTFINHISLYASDIR